MRCVTDSGNKTKGPGELNPRIKLKMERTIESQPINVTSDSVVYKKITVPKHYACFFSF